MTEARYCTACGVTLGAEASFCGSCGTSALSTSDVKCPQCGNDNPADDQFCGGCGASLSGPVVSGIGVGTAELPMVSFIDAIKLGYKKKFTFSGRATKAEFWWFYLFFGISFYAMFFIYMFLQLSSEWFLQENYLYSVFFVGIVFPLIYFIIVGIPSLSLSSRRLHDTGRSGWWWLLNLTVFLGFPVGSIFLIVWWCRKGDEGPNKYGPDPRQPTPQQPEIKLGGKYIPHGTPNNSFPNYLAGIPTWKLYLLSAIGSLLCILFTVEVYLWISHNYTNDLHGRDFTELSWRVYVEGLSGLVMTHVGLGLMAWRNIKKKGWFQ